MLLLCRFCIGFRFAIQCDVFLRRTRSGNEEQAQKHKRETAQTCTHTERCKVSYSIPDITYKLYILVFRRAKSLGAVAARASSPLPLAALCPLSRRLPTAVCVREKAEIYLIRTPNVVQPLHALTRSHRGRTACATHGHTHTYMRARARFADSPNVGITHGQQFPRHLNSSSSGRMNRTITIE